MKKAKKILLTAGAYLLTVALAIGGTVAYLQAEDSDVNVMTLGNVKIEQIEQQYDENGELVDFKQGKPLYPYVGEFGWKNTDEANGAYRQFTMNNVVDKYVSVKNTGKSDAYVRTLIAFEMGDFTYEEFTKIGISNNLENGSEFKFPGTWNIAGDFVAEINGQNYNIVEFVHTNPVKSGETTIPSLLQVYLSKEADNEDVEKLDGNKNSTYDILALSQAVQTAGFENAQTALDTAFGKSSEKAVEWFKGIIVPNYSTTATEVKTVLTTAPDGTNIAKKVSKIIYGKNADYPEIVNGGYETATIDNATAYYVPDGKNYIVYMLADGVIYAPVNSKNLFADMSNVTEIDTSNLDFSHVQNALGMFVNCSKLETLDTASWDVSNITNMQSIFYGCNNLKNIDVSGWDTSNVTNMRMVFFRCYALDNETLKGVENWDVSNVTNFYSMFKHARGLTSLDLSKWDTSNATTMSHMFANIGGLQELDLSGFNTANVKDMSWMFYDASKLTTIYVGDGWTTAAVDVANTSKPFYNNQALVGEKGTTWLDVCDMANANRPWESSAKIDYAIVDAGATNPGLLTYKK